MVTLPQNPRIFPKAVVPQLVQTAGPISLVKANGIWTISLNQANIPTQIFPPVANWNTDYILVYDNINKQNILIPMMGTLLMSGQFGFHLRGINLNALGDTPMAITLPPGVTLWHAIANFRLSNPSIVMATAQFQVWTGPGGTGVQVVGTTTVNFTSTAPDTAGNLQTVAVLVNINTQAMNDTVLYFRVINIQGAPATCDFTVQVIPL